MENRDLKGRFTEGNHAGVRFSGGYAAEAAKASHEARKENNRIADIVRRVLDEPSSLEEDKSRMDEYVEKIIKSVFSASPSLDDLLKLQKLIGEDVRKLQIEDQSIPVILIDDGLD